MLIWRKKDEEDYDSQNRVNEEKKTGEATHCRNRCSRNPKKRGTQGIGISESLDFRRAPRILP